MNHIFANKNTANIFILFAATVNVNRFGATQKKKKNEIERKIEHISNVSYKIITAVQLALNIVKYQVFKSQRDTQY